VLATDDAALANRLWGDNKRWDDRRGQWVPAQEGTDEASDDATDGTEGGDPPSPGKTSSTSSTKPAKKVSGVAKGPHGTARTTGPS
jgi:hypothetical protein